MTRPTNVELVAQFRELLTGGANDAMIEIAAHVFNRVSSDELLQLTKNWRGELWKAFNEIEERLCPLEVETRRRLKAKDEQAS